MAREHNPCQEIDGGFRRRPDGSQRSDHKFPRPSALTQKVDEYWNGILGVRANRRNRSEGATTIFGVFGHN
jgi:hypothetical protein